MFYKKIVSKDKSSVYIIILNKNISNETYLLLERLKKSTLYNLSESSKTLYVFENFKDSENIDEIFETFGIPLMDIENKKKVKEVCLNNGEYKGLPLYCIPSKYLFHVFQTTYDKNIKEKIEVILKKRFFI